MKKIGFALLLLVGSSLTAAVWAAGAGLALVVLRFDWLRQKGFWFRALPWTLAGLSLGGYYLFTLLEGYRATGFHGERRGRVCGAGARLSRQAIRF